MFVYNSLVNYEALKIILINHINWDYPHWNRANYTTRWQQDDIKIC